MGYKEKLHIDIIDFAKGLLKSWKSLALGAVIGAVAIGGYGYTKSAVTVDSKTGEPYTGESDSEYASFKAAISEGDAVYVEKLAHQYLVYAKEYAEILDYGDRSIALKIDSYNAPEMTTAYAIDELENDGAESTTVLYGSNEDGFVVESNVSNISGAFGLALKDDKVLEAIKAEAGLDVDNSVLSELISVGTSGKNILTVSAVGTDKEMCEAVMPVLEKKVEEVSTNIKSTYDFELSKIDTYYKVGNNSSLDSIQRSYTDYLTSIRGGINSMAAGLTPEQKEYYTALISDINTEVLGNKVDIESYKGLSTGEESVQAQVETKVVRRLDIKYIVLGIVGGVFVTVFVLAVLYVISGKLRIKDDLSYAFGLSILGEIKDEERDKIGMIASEVGITASKINASKVCVIGSAKDKKAMDIKKLVCEEIAKRAGIDSCICCEDVLSSSADMERMSETDAVILVEKKNVSKYEDISKELELCDKYDVKTLGSIFVK